MNLIEEEAKYVCGRKPLDYLLINIYFLSLYRNTCWKMIIDPMIILSTPAKHNVIPLQPTYNKDAINSPPVLCTTYLFLSF